MTNAGNRTGLIPGRDKYNLKWVTAATVFTLIVSLAAGLPISGAVGSVWWLAIVGSIVVFATALVVAARGGPSDLLAGSSLGMAYSFVLMVVYMTGQLLEVLPDPLPGLDPSDSTLFFVWPLAATASGTLGTAFGRRFDGDSR